MLSVSWRDTFVTRARVTGNLYMQKNEPWNEANKASGRYIISLTLLVNTIRFISALFEPFLPSLSAKINFMLGQDIRTPRDEKILEHLVASEDPIDGILSLVPAGQTLNEPLPIFRKRKKQGLKLKDKHPTSSNSFPLTSRRC